MNEFVKYARIYDLMYPEKNYSREADYILNQAQKFCDREISSILEFGAGKGHLAAQFQLRGKKVTATDVSAQMAELSLPSVNVSIADIRAYEGKSQFDLAVAFFHVLSYLTSDDDVLAGFSSIAGALKPGAVFVGDYWHLDAVMALKPSTRVKSVSSQNFEIVRIAEPDWDKSARIVNVNYKFFYRQKPETTFEMFDEEHRMRYFEVSELRAFAESAGLEMVSAEETLTGATPSEKSWGVTGVFIKK